MIKRKLSVVIGAALAASIGTVSADSIVLTDSEMDTVTAGRGFESLTNVIKTLEITETILEQKLALFQVEVIVNGWSAVAEAEADSEGPNTDAQTFTFAEVYPTTDGFFKSTSLSKSIALGSLGGTIQ